MLIFSRQCARVAVQTCNFGVDDCALDGFLFMVSSVELLISAFPQGGDQGVERPDYLVSSLMSIVATFMSDGAIWAGEL